MDKEIELGLRDIYYNHQRLYKKALENGLLVKEWLKSQDIYTRYKPVVIKQLL